MTRINIGIKPATLHDKHLLAEHREIVRIPNSIKRGRYNFKDIPTKFKMGKGHVKFFYDKLKYLHKRYDEIHNECICRGFNVTDFSDSFKDLPCEFYNDYSPTKEDIGIISLRLEEKIKKL